LFDFQTYAVDFTWKGTSSDWNNPANWTVNAGGSGIDPALLYPGAGGRVDNVTIGSGGSANPLLQTGISIANFTFGSKTLDLNGFNITVSGNSTFNLGKILNGRLIVNSTGSTSFKISGMTDFDLKVKVIAPNIIISGGLFRDSAYFEKTGTGDDGGQGGFEFYKHVEFVHSAASGYLYLGNSQVNIFHDNVTFTNKSTGIISVARNVKINYFEGDIFVNSSMGGGVFIGTFGAGKSILSPGKKIKPGGLGIIAGTLGISNFFHADSSGFNFTLSGTSGFSVSGTTTFYQKVKVVAPNIYIDGGIFHDSVYFEKTSFGQNNGLGGATFFNHLEIANSGSGVFYLGTNTPDIFHQNITLTNKGIGQIYIARNSGVNYLRGNVFINSTTGGTVGIESLTTGKAILGSGKKIIIGNQGFDKGSFMLSNFFLEDSSDFNFTMYGSSTFNVKGTSTFYKKIKVVAPVITINGGIFHDSAYFERNSGIKTGAGNGGAVFNKPVEFVNSGSGIFYIGTMSPDLYNSDATYTTKGSGDIEIARNSSVNYFNGNIYVNSKGSGTIIFNRTETSTMILKSGKKMETGRIGFSAGKLSLNNFNTDASGNLNLAFTGTSSFYIKGGTFNGKLSVTSPDINLNGVIFKDSVYFNKTGSLSNNFIGSNSFEKPVKILVSNGNLYMGEATYSTNTIFNFKDNINLSQLNSGKLYLAYNGAIVNLEADLSIDAINVFPLIGYSGGQINFIGSKNHSLTYRDTLQINKMSVNKSEGKVLLNTSIKFLTSDSKIPLLNLVKGNINTGIGCVHITEGTVLTGSSALSFIEGKVKKTGASAFTFPVGKNGLYRPVTISAPGNTTASYEIEYFNSSPSDRDKLASSVKIISDCEYWSINRTPVSGNVSVKAEWTNSCTGISSSAKVAYKNTVTGKWEELSGAVLTGDKTAGSFQTPVLTAYGTFTFASDSPPVYLNTASLPSKPFRILGIGKDSEIFTSGSSGTNAGKVELFPSSYSGGITLDVLPDATSTGLKIFLTFTAGSISKVEAEVDSTRGLMNPSTYRIENGNEIIFRSGTEETEEMSIVSNLEDGLLMKRGSILSFTIPADFTGNALRIIKPVTNEQLIFNTLSWDGKWYDQSVTGGENNKTDAPEGVYKYEIDMQDSEGVLTIEGQFILR
jgi:hypothetical protein